MLLSIAKTNNMLTPDSQINDNFEEIKEKPDEC